VEPTVEVEDVSLVRYSGNKRALLNFISLFLNFLGEDHRVLCELRGDHISCGVFARVRELADDSLLVSGSNVRELACILTANI